MCRWSATFVLISRVTWCQTGRSVSILTCKSFFVHFFYEYCCDYCSLSYLIAVSCKLFLTQDLCLFTSEAAGGEEQIVLHFRGSTKLRNTIPKPLWPFSQHTNSQNIGLSKGNLGWLKLYYFTQNT